MHAAQAARRLSTQQPLHSTNGTLSNHNISTQAHVTQVASPSSSAAAMQWQGEGKLAAVAVETVQTTVHVNGPSTQQGGINLAQLLVNEPELVKEELKRYSKDFVKFWRDKRAEFCKLVAQEKKELHERQTAPESFNQSHKHEDFDLPRMPQVAEAGYADKAFIKQVVKYGEMVQAVYDTLETKDVYSRFFGRCMAGVMTEGFTLGHYNRSFINVGEAAAKYRIVKQIEADSGAYKLVTKEGRNYVGFIAEGPADSNQPWNSTADVDVAVVFRGTIVPSEWQQDFKALQVRWNGGNVTEQSPSTFLRVLPFQPPPGAFTATLALSLLLLWAIHAGTGSAPAGSSPLSFSIALATGVWLVTGFARAYMAHATHWLNDMKMLVDAVVPWTKFGLSMLKDALRVHLPGCRAPR